MALTSVNIQKFTSSGTYTPTPGMKYITAECVGGGAGSTTVANVGNNMRSGSGGGYCKKTLSSVDIGATEVITVGAGGAPASSTGTSGNPGGISSFGSHMTANGGVAIFGWFPTSYYTFGQEGGTATGGDINIKGGWSGSPLYITNEGAPVNIYRTLAGDGGRTVMSQNSVGVAYKGSSVAGQDGYEPGGGGGCPYGPATGSRGSNGVVIITEYL